MAESMLANLLRTPKQIREEELLKMQQQAAAQASLGGVMQGQSSALPGIFSSVMQQQRPALATDMAQTARGLTQGIGGMLGAVGAKDLGRAVSQATVSPEERQAAQAQQAIKGVDQNNPEALLALAQKLSAQGLAGPAQQIGQLARTVQAKQAEIGLTQSKTITEKSTQRKNIAAAAKDYAAAGYSEEQTATEIQRRNPELSLLEAQKIAEQAKAELDQERANQVKAMTPEQVSLLKAQTKAQESGVKLDAKRMALLSAQISTEEVKKRAEDKGITEADARIELLEAETDRYIALTPLEVIAQGKEIAKLEAGTEKDRQQAALAKARLGDIGQTEFLRELNAADYTKEEKDALIKKRVDALVTPEGITGAASAMNASKVDMLVQYSDKAIGTGPTLERIERSIGLLDSTNVGRFGAPKAYFNKILGDVFGVESSKQATVANELFEVLNKGLTLDRAENLKGALSERDLEFLVASGVGAFQSVETVQKLLLDYYKKTYSDQFVALALENKMTGMSNKDLSGFKATQFIRDQTEMAELRAEQELSNKLTAASQTK